MSFLKITDPTKREASVKEFLELKNRIKDNFRSERIGEIEAQSDLSKFFKLLLKRKKLQLRRLRSNLNLLEKVSRVCPHSRLLRFPPFHR